MDRQEIAEKYSIDSYCGFYQGNRMPVILNSGIFQNLPVFAPYFYEKLISAQNIELTNIGNQAFYQYFDTDKSDVGEFPELKATRRLLTVLFKHSGSLAFCIELLSFKTCRYCKQSVEETLPHVDDDIGWNRVTKDHSKDCEWVKSRNFRLDPNRLRIIHTSSHKRPISIVFANGLSYKAPEPKMTYIASVMADPYRQLPDFGRWSILGRRKSNPYADIPVDLYLTSCLRNGNAYLLVAKFGNNQSDIASSYVFPDIDPWLYLEHDCTRIAYKLALEKQLVRPRTSKSSIELNFLFSDKKQVLAS